MKIKTISIVSLLVAVLLTEGASADANQQSKIASTFKVERNVVYGMFSGLALLMDVYYPSESNGRAIIFVSGSGWTRELSLDAQMLTATGQEDIYAAPLAEAGYTVFNVNHRAAPRFRYPAPIEDLQRAVKFIRYHADIYGIDPDRIGGMGGSSGGHLVGMLATLDGEGEQTDPSEINRQSSKIQAAVTRAAPFDLRENPTAPLFGYRSIAAKPGTLEKHLMNIASPIVHISADDPPILMIHGDADNVVPIENSIKMQAELNKAGIPNNLITVKGGGHGPRYEYNAIENGEPVRKIPENAPDYIGAMIDWFDKYLLDKQI